MRLEFKRRPLKSDMALQITSMADIFILILVFLLKSYSTSSINVSLSRGMQLPVAQLTQAPIEALQVEISESAVQVEKKPSTLLSNFKFEPSDLDSTGISKELKLVLEREKQRQKLIAQSNPNVKVDSKILIIADQRTPYKTIKTVLASAAINGFTDFKLVTVNKD